MTSELIDVVNRNDQVVGQSTKDNAFAKSLLHRASSLFIFNKKGQVYLQQRAAKKTTFPNYWDLSVTEHVKAGESYEKAAQRGAMEELGTKETLVLELIRDTHFQDNSYKQDGVTTFDLELIQTFKTVNDGPFQIDPEEVSAGEFFELEEVDDSINKAKLLFTPWFLEEWSCLVEVRSMHES